MVAIRYPNTGRSSPRPCVIAQGEHAIDVKSPSLTAPILAKKSRKLVLRPVDASLSAADEVDLKKRPSSRVVHKEELVFELHRSDQASRIAIEGLVCLLAARTGRRCTLPKSAMPEWLCKAVELIRSEYSHGISLAQVAASAGVHPVTVVVAFRRHFGKSVGDCIADLRTAHARQELENNAPPNC
jgi:hypothetical protein